MIAFDVSKGIDTYRTVGVHVSVLFVISQEKL